MRQDDFAGLFLRNPPKMRRPHFLKMGVEGAEAEVLKGAVSILDEYSPIVSIATHSPELDMHCNRKE